jgi:hypothetical protein
MKHKFATLPSLGWATAAMRRFVNKRSEFQVKPDFWGIKLLDGFEPNEPIYVRAIFVGLFKRPKTPHTLAYANECEFYFAFRDVIFHQCGKERWLLNTTRKANKQRTQCFLLKDIQGGGLLTDQGSFSPVQDSLRNNDALIGLSFVASQQKTAGTPAAVLGDG